MVGLSFNLVMVSLRSVTEMCYKDARGAALLIPWISSINHASKTIMSVYFSEVCICSVMNLAVFLKLK